MDVFNIYVRLTPTNLVHHIFCSDQENIQEGDILWLENQVERPNYSLADRNGKYYWKWDNVLKSLVRRSRNERYTLEEQKQMKINGARSICNRVILDEYPIEDQMDLIGQIDPEEDLEEDKLGMFNFIKEKRIIFRLYRDSVSQASSFEELDIVSDPDFS